MPTFVPTRVPTPVPQSPSRTPTPAPSLLPSLAPTPTPSHPPTRRPTRVPTPGPTAYPTTTAPTPGCADLFPLVIGGANGNGCVLYTKPPSPKKDEDEFSLQRWLKRRRHWVPLAWSAAALGACILLSCLGYLVLSLWLKRRPEKIETAPAPEKRPPPKKPLRSRVAPPPSSSESGTSSSESEAPVPRRRRRRRLRDESSDDDDRAPTQDLLFVDHTQRRHRELLPLPPGGRGDDVPTARLPPAHYSDSEDDVERGRRRVHDPRRRRTDGTRWPGRRAFGFGGVHRVSDYDSASSDPDDLGFAKRRSARPPPTPSFPPRGLASKPLYR